MAVKIIMPKLGMAMKDGTVVKWLKEGGAEVKTGDPIVVVMTKKITYEVTSPADGILRPTAKPKDVFLINQTIGYVTAPGKEIPKEEVGAAAPAAAAAEAPVTATPAEVKPEASKEGDFLPSSPAARRLARELGVELSKVRTAGPRITEEDVKRYHEEQGRIVASPLARRMAEEEGLDLSQIVGSGPGGRITEEDVLRALETGKGPITAPLDRIPFVGMRQAIAEQMVSSLQTMAQITMNTTVDVTELKSTREAMGARWGRKTSYTDLLVKAVTVALKEHPLLGAKLVDDEIVMPTEFNIGVAVALDAGLIVPVIRNADRLTVIEISDKVLDLADRARKGTLDMDEVTNSTFTITNLGMFGIDAFTPIVNPPEVAILGVGRIAQELAPVAGQIAVRDKMTLSLTIDHRIVDGAPGAKFLQTLVQLLEHPALIFAGAGG